LFAAFPSFFASVTDRFEGKWFYSFGIGCFFDCLARVIIHRSNSNNYAFLDISLMIFLDTEKGHFKQGWRCNCSEDNHQTVK
jgi:hypothetical protein